MSRKSISAEDASSLKGSSLCKRSSKQTASSVRKSIESKISLIESKLKQNSTPMAVETGGEIPVKDAQSTEIPEKEAKATEITEKVGQVTETPENDVKAPEMPEKDSQVVNESKEEGNKKSKRGKLKM